MRNKDLDKMELKIKQVIEEIAANGKKKINVPVFFKPFAYWSRDVCLCCEKELFPYFLIGLSGQQ